MYKEVETGAIYLLVTLFPKALADDISPFRLFPYPDSIAHPCISFSIQSEVSFEGAYGNLNRLYDKAAKMYHQLKKCETRKLSPSKKR
jgi:hypothetical protein